MALILSTIILNNYYSEQCNFTSIHSYSLENRNLKFNLQTGADPNRRPATARAQRRAALLAQCEPGRAMDQSAREGLPEGDGRLRLPRFQLGAPLPPTPAQLVETRECR